MTEQVPSRILTEREKLETACQEIIFTAHRLEKTGGEYYSQLDQRLIKLPDDIAERLNPISIVALINSLLKKQFEATTIPTVANKLAANAEIITNATKEYAQANKELSGSWRTVADEAHKTIEKIQSAVAGAANASQKAAVDFSNIYKKTYRKTLLILGAIMLGTGIMIGILIYSHFGPNMKTIYEIPPEVQIQIERKKEWDMKFAPMEK